MCKIGEFTIYKGFKGTIEYSYSDNLYFGSLKDTDDYIDYHASNVVNLYERYKEAVDSYIVQREKVR